MKNKHLWIEIVFFTWIVISPLPTLATVVEKMTSTELIEESGLVFGGFALEVDPNAYDEASDAPFTRVRFSVDEVLYGDYLDDEIEFLVPGGFTKDGMILSTGAPTFDEGEFYLLFVRKGDWYFTPVTNWWHSVAREVEIDGEYFFADTEGRVIKDFYSSGLEAGKHTIDKSSSKSEYVETKQSGKSSSDTESNLDTYYRADEILDSVFWAIDEKQPDVKTIRTEPKRLNYTVVRPAAE